MSKPFSLRNDMKKLGSTSFTPGPWLISSSTFVCTKEAKIIANCSPLGVCSLDLPLEEARNNARLIAAAPEMYEALKEAIHEFNNFPHSLGYRITHTPKWEKIISKIEGK